MLIREKESLNYRCCNIVKSVPGGGSHAQDCLGCDCMAWRWCAVQLDPERPGPDGLLRGEYGYCGLAGEPTYDDELMVVRARRGCLEAMDDE